MLEELYVFPAWLIHKVEALFRAVKVHLHSLLQMQRPTSGAGALQPSDAERALGRGPGADFTHAHSLIHTPDLFS